MTDTEIKECQEWLDKLKLDDIPKGYKWQRSLMDITGIKHHENMWSDIYKFFFNEKEGHNMKDLFIRSLEQILKIEPNFLGDFKVEREYGAENQKRIDILLKDEENHRAIIIENKVYHTLNNDLDNYYKSICMKGYNDNDVKVVVLGLTKYKLKEGYISITHIDLLDKVLGNIHKYLPAANSNYVYLLQEFYKNIKNHTNMIDKKEVEFFFNKENQQKMVKIHDIYRHIKDYLIMVMECKDGSPLKDHIKRLGLCPKSEKTGKGEEYVKYVFDDNSQIMLTVFYKNSILRPDDGETPHIQIILEIQKDIKRIVENNMEKFIALRDSFSDDIITNEKKRNEWWHFASMEIHVKDFSKFPEILFDAINKECPLYKLGHEILNEIERNKQK